MNAYQLKEKHEFYVSIAKFTLALLVATPILVYYQSVHRVEELLSRWGRAWVNRSGGWAEVGSEIECGECS